MLEVGDWEIRFGSYIGGLKRASQPLSSECLENRESFRWTIDRSSCSGALPV